MTDMSCDECGKETDGGIRKEFIAGVTISQQTYDTGTAIVGQNTYTGFAPVEAMLCDECFHSRGRRLSRDWMLSTAGLLLGGAGLLFISYNIWFWIFFISGNQVPSLPWWQIVGGLLCGLIGLFLLKLAWEQLQPGTIKWRADSPVTTEEVLHPYALAKAKAAGKDTIWTVQRFEIMQQTF